MGREIRRVPANWQHPKEQKEQLVIGGNELEDFMRAFATGRTEMREVYKPLFDRTHQEALEEWETERAKFERDQSPEGIEHRAKYTFEEWHGERPDPEYYRPAWTEATHYQMYETVSEGTPVSPVFATLEELADWLVSEGYSPQAARAFCKDGWAPSFVGVGGLGLIDGVTAAGVWQAKTSEHEG